MEKSFTDNLYSLLSKYRQELMGFAALWIMYFHLWMPILLPYSMFWYVEATIRRIGFIGVDIFFFLSGMGLVNAIRKSSNLKDFYIRRIRKLLIPYWVYVLIKNLIFGLEIKTILNELFFIPIFTQNIYEIFWFIPAMMAMYLLFPLYYKALDKSKNPFKFTLIFIVVFLVASLGLIPFVRRDLYGMINRIPIIVTGILLGYTGKKVKVKADNRLIASALVSFVVGLAIILFIYTTNTYITPASDAGLPAYLIALGSVTCIALLLTKFSSSSVLNKILCWFGSFSLEFYFAQETLRLNIRPILEESISKPITNIILIALAICFGFILHLICTGINKLTSKSKTKVA